MRTPSPVAPADHCSTALYGKSPSSRYAASLADSSHKVRQEARRRARACRIRRASVLFSSAKLDGSWLRWNSASGDARMVRSLVRHSPANDRQAHVKTEQRVIIITQRSFRRPGGVAASMIISGFCALASIRPSQAPDALRHQCSSLQLFYRCEGDDIAQLERIAANQVIRTAGNSFTRLFSPRVMANASAPVPLPRRPCPTSSSP